MQVKKRSEIDKKYLWDINSMYGSDKAWQEDVDKALELAKELSIEDRRASCRERV